MSYAAPIGWTEERVARLRVLAMQGATASMIARDLGGVSRNAVIGKMGRLGIPSISGLNGADAIRSHTGRLAVAKPRSKPRPAPGLSSRKSAPAPMAPPPPPQAARRPVAGRRPIMGPNARTLVDLPPNTCRFPIDDPGPGNMDRTLFCGEPLEGPGVYCPSCRALAWKHDPSRRAA